MRNGISRRRFLRLSSGAALAMIAGPSLAGASEVPEGQRFYESSCRKNEQSSQRILIAYASRCGSTGSIAEAMGEVLCGAGAAVDVSLVEHVKDPSPYQAVIVGSAIRKSRWLPEAVSFVKSHQEALSRVPTAYFVVCLTMRDDTPENRNTVLAYLDPVRKSAPHIAPASIGLFPGVVDFSKVSFMYQAILEAKGIAEGDYRNLPAVKAWASALGPAFIAGRDLG